MQIFHRSTNTLSRATIYGAIFVVAALFWAAAEIQRSPYVTYAGVRRPQPVPFSHQHHVAGLGIDCRYCHTSVETSSYAGIPPTKTCMNCHAQIWTNAALLEPVRESYKSGKSLVWTRVNDLPDFAYFNHSIHINKGVGCNTCHGPRGPHAPDVSTRLRCRWSGVWSAIGRQRKISGRATRFSTCVTSNRSSGKPVEFDGKEYTDQLSLGTDLVKKYKLRTVTDITSCSTCHR